MKRLSEKEEEIMGLFWKFGTMSVRELLDHYDEPRPHFNTLSTFVRSLEAKGMLGHERYGHSHRYYAAQSAEEYSRATLPNILSRMFGGSPLNMVSTLVKEEAVSIDELRELLDEIEKEEGAK